MLEGMRYAVVLWTSLVAVSALALTGCTSSGTPTAAPTTSASSLATVQPHTLDGDMPDHSLPLPTSDWKAGDPAFEVLLASTLHREGPCLVADSARNPTAVVWPAGFTASRSSDGIFHVHNVAGSVVASTGEKFSTGGAPGPTDVQPWKDMPCVGEYDLAFFVQDSMTGDGP